MVTIWTTSVIGASIAGGYLVWQLFIAYAERRGAPTQSLMQTATNDPGVQQLIASGASKQTVEDRLAMITGTSDDLAALKSTIQAFMIGNVIAFVVIMAIIVIGAVLLHRRQKRRRADYEVRITESVTRAAQLTM